MTLLFPARLRMSPVPRANRRRQRGVLLGMSENFEVVPIVRKGLRGTRYRGAPPIPAVEKGLRYQSQKIASLKNGLRDDDREGGLEKREPLAERKGDGKDKQRPNKC